MPRAGLNTADVVVAGAELADEAGIEAVSLATLAMTEFGDALRDALQGRSGLDAIAALFTALQGCIADHPGRYSATTAAKLQGPDDPLLAPSTRVIESIRAVLSGYGVPAEDLDHAIRTAQHR